MNNFSIVLFRVKHLKLHIYSSITEAIASFNLQSQFFDNVISFILTADLIGERNEMSVISFFISKNPFYALCWKFVVEVIS